MKLRLTIASLAAATVLLPAAHGQMTGTSHPEQLDDQITTSPAPSSAPHYVKPSPAIPAPAPAQTTNSYPPAEPAPAVAAMPAPVPAQSAEGRRLLTPSADPDANIVTSVPDVPGQVNEGTPLRARLQNPLSTQETKVGDTFLAELVQPVTQHGVVLIPVGAQIRGRISAVHGGRRLTGRASIRLQPDFITFPDGTSHRIHAELIDLDNFADAHVNSEGTVVGTEHHQGDDCRHRPYYRQRSRSRRNHRWRRRRRHWCSDRSRRRHCRVAQARRPAGASRRHRPRLLTRRAPHRHLFPSNRRAGTLGPCFTRAAERPSTTEGLLASTQTIPAAASSSSGCAGSVFFRSSRIR